jgi:hypothetical protein
LTYLDAEHAEGQYNSCSSTGGSTFGSALNTLSTIGNGVKDSSRHNAFEVRQSGDIYIPDVSAAGNYYEKPMIHLQQKLYAIDASINALEQGGGGGGSSFDPTNFVFVDVDAASGDNILKISQGGGTSSTYLTSIKFDDVKSSTFLSTDDATGDYIMLDNGQMFVCTSGDMYQIDLARFCADFGTIVTP